MSCSSMSRLRRADCPLLPCECHTNARFRALSRIGSVGHGLHPQHVRSGCRRGCGSRCGFRIRILLMRLRPPPGHLGSGSPHFVGANLPLTASSSHASGS